MNLYNVFTPSTIAKATFVERDYLNDQLISALRTPGKQIIIYGESGSGKSTLIQNKYKTVYQRCIISKCTKKSTFESLIEDAFGQFEKFLDTEISESTTMKATAGFSLPSIFRLGGEATDGKTTKRERVAPFQHNEANLSRLLNESKACWIIEDFHKVTLEVKDNFADSLKIFTDSASKVILIGAVGSATEILKYNSEMKNRITEINVPPMDPTDLERIINKGSQELNIEFEEKLIKGIINLSTKKGAVCHQLCLDICKGRKIYETQADKITISYLTLKKAINDQLFASSGAFKIQYEKMKLVELSERVLFVFLKLGKDSANLDNILDYLNQEKPTNVKEDAVKQTLDKLTTQELGNVLKINHFGEYSFENLFYLAYCAIQLKFDEDDTNLLDNLSPSSRCETILDLLRLKDE